MKYHLIIANQAYSSWSLRGWLLLKAFGIDFTYEVVPLYTDEFRQFQEVCAPSLTVPTLKVSDGSSEQVIWDSFALAEFLHEQHPKAGLFPEEVIARASARSLMAEMHSGFMAMRGSLPMNVRRRYKRFELSPEVLQDVERILALWDWARSHWGGQGPYLFGTRFHAVDAFFAPVASRFQTYGVQLDKNDSAYVDALLSHPATIEFVAAGFEEEWVIPDSEFDVE